MPVQMRTILEVADNSGAKRLSCILPLGGSTGLKAGLGDIITASVKEASPDSNVKKGSVVKCVIVRTRKETRRKDGILYPFRRERRGADQRRPRTDRDPRLRTRGPRIARQEIHEDRFTRSGGDLDADRPSNQEERRGLRPARQGPRQDRPRADRHAGRRENRRRRRSDDQAAYAANPQRNIKGGIVEKEAPIQISNVALVCKNCGSTRASNTRFSATAARARTCKKCGNTIE